MTVTGEARPSVGINRPMILATITLSTMVVVLDMSITVIALPHMQGGLSATADQVAWVMTSYIVTMSIMIAYTGWLASRIGRRRLYIASTVLFTVGALLSGSADSLTELVIYRSIQGAAAAPAFPLGQAIILDSFPRERHGQALALLGGRHHGRPGYRPNPWWLYHRDLRLAVGVFSRRTARRPLSPAGFKILGRCRGGPAAQVRLAGIRRAGSGARRRSADDGSGSTGRLVRINRNRHRGGDRRVGFICLDRSHADHEEPLPAAGPVYRPQLHARPRVFLCARQPLFCPAIMC